MAGEISLKAQVLLDPLNKYKYFGKFPWIPFVHMVIVMLDSYIILQMNNIESGMLSAMKTLLTIQLCNKDAEVDEIGLQRDKYFNNI
jgi:hypothetical protein